MPVSTLQDATPAVSRRALLKLALGAASLLAMPPSLAPLMASALAATPRRPVIWLSFQECTGCTESLARAEAPTLEYLLFSLISLDYHHTFQAAAGERAELARLRTMATSPGGYLLIVDGSIPTGAGGAYSTIAGVSNLDLLRECAATAAAVIAVGTCAAFGGLPKAAPNPTGATDVSTLMPPAPHLLAPAGESARLSADTGRTRGGPGPLAGVRPLSGTR